MEAETMMNLNQTGFMFVEQVMSHLWGVAGGGGGLNVRFAYLKRTSEADTKRPVNSYYNVLLHVCED